LVALREWAAQAMLATSVARHPDAGKVLSRSEVQSIRIEWTA